MRKLKLREISDLLRVACEQVGRLGLKLGTFVLEIWFISPSKRLLLRKASRYNMGKQVEPFKRKQKKKKDLLKRRKKTILNPWLIMLQLPEMLQFNYMKQNSYVYLTFY